MRFLTWYEATVAACSLRDAVRSCDALARPRGSWVACRFNIEPLSRSAVDLSRNRLARLGTALFQFHSLFSPEQQRIYAAVDTLRRCIPWGVGLILLPSFGVSMGGLVGGLVESAGESLG